MNDKQLKSFIAMAELKSFSKAAEAAFISVTALIKQIDALEHEIGVQLVCRSNKGTCLTAAGERFLEKCRFAVRYLTDAIQEVNAVALAEDRTIRIGYGHTIVSVSIYPDALYSYKEEHPEAKIQPIDLSSDFKEPCDLILNAHLLNDHPDIIENMEPHILCTMPVCCVMRNSHPLSDKSSITLKDLRKYEIEMPNPKVVKQVVPDLLRNLQKEGMRFSEVSARSANAANYIGLISSEQIAISLGYPRSLSHYLTLKVLDGYQFDYMIYSHRGGKKPIADSHLEFLKRYYQSRFEGVSIVSCK